MRPGARSSSIRGAETGNGASQHLGHARFAVSRLRQRSGTWTRRFQRCAPATLSRLRGSLPRCDSHNPEHPGQTGSHPARADHRRSARLALAYLDAHDPRASLLDDNDCSLDGSACLWRIRAGAPWLAGRRDLWLDRRGPIAGGNLVLCRNEQSRLGSRPGARAGGRPPALFLDRHGSPAAGGKIAGTGASDLSALLRSRGVGEVASTHHRPAAPESADAGRTARCWLTSLPTSPGAMQPAPLARPALSRDWNSPSSRPGRGLAAHSGPGHDSAYEKRCA